MWGVGWGTGRELTGVWVVQVSKVLTGEITGCRWEKETGEGGRGEGRGTFSKGKTVCDGIGDSKRNKLS